MMNEAGKSDRPIVESPALAGRLNVFDYCNFGIYGNLVG